MSRFDVHARRWFCRRYLHGPSIIAGGVWPALAKGAAQRSRYSEMTSLEEAASAYFE